jgi:uncharacterized protein YjbI with pentapeptide repeats
MSVAKVTSNSLRERDLFIEPDLTGAELREAHLARANLFRAELSEANLSRAKLTGAELREADLSGADLCGADLREASLTQEELEAATGDENTQLPAEINPPAHWGVKTEEQAKED